MLPSQDEEVEPEKKPKPVTTFNPLNEPLTKKEPAKEIEYFEDAETDLEEPISSPGLPNFNIEDLVKRIDKKIAELEKEEAEENEKIEIIDEKQEEKEEQESIEKLENTIYERFDDFLKDTEDEIEELEPVINIDQDSVIVDTITDDQYYDDFFQED